MSTLVTPSAKAHERVTGRWIRDIQVATKRDWFIYYAKSIVGAPVPFLMMALVCLAFFSRGAVETAAWACAALTALYIVFDRFAQTREFSFFRVGSDFFLLGYLLFTIATAFTQDSGVSAIATIGDARWILLFYGLAYSWELFPGVNRLFTLMMAAAAICAAYGIWQHFTGVDLLRPEALANAPAPNRPYFISTGFFGTTELYGTLLATIIPFPAAAFLLSEKRDEWYLRWLPLGLVLGFGLAVFWTYRPGLWMAAFVGMVITLLMQSKNTLLLLGSVFGFFLVVSFAFYGSPEAMFDSVQTAEIAHSTQQRAQINTQVELWQNNTWIGVGHEATRASGYDPGTGNVYFQILAQTGVFGAAFYLLFILAFLLSTYRIFQEIPSTHHWHRVLISGGLGSQIAFHAAGLYWATMTEAVAVNLFIFLISAVSYVSEHYSRGLVTDDSSL